MFSREEKNSAYLIHFGSKFFEKIKEFFEKTEGNFEIFV